MERTFAPARNASTQTPFKASRPLRLFALLLTWHQRARTRRQLAELSEQHLADVGISLADRHTELDKPFWRE
ncbi:DUF1127 domain-containing protein [Pseudomonas sp. LRF_L74]|uniref:DUF1127 domain-containing protein n=1 Tax=Pseudomonas sp. LRF_L74 TaxID=3369422 RepID=UPI003F60B945